MNIVENIKNKNFKGLRIATTVTSIIAYGLLIAYLLYMSINVWQEHSVFAVLFVLMVVLCIFGFGLEVNLAWGSLNKKDGTIEIVKKGTFVSAVVLNVVTTAFGVMCWIVELGW